MSTFFTILVGAIAAGIAYAQWRTAHQRIVLDLFEKRFADYMTISEIVGFFQQNGKADGEQMNRFRVARARAKFLFGPEVYEYLRRLHDDLELATMNYDAATRIAQSEEKMLAPIERIGDFWTEMDRFVAPYISLPIKLPSMWFPWPPYREWSSTNPIRRAEAFLRGLRR